MAYDYFNPYNFGQGDLSLGTGFDGINLSSIDTSTPPLADNSNGAPSMSSTNWGDLSWIGAGLDKALNFTLAKDQLDYKNQAMQQQNMLALSAQRYNYAAQYGGLGVPPGGALTSRQLLLFGALGLGIFLMVKA